MDANRHTPPAALSDACTMYEQISVYEHAPGEAGVCYAGYPLPLSECEVCILLCLLRALRDGRETVEEAVLAGCLSACTEEKCLAAHIRSINRKTEDIGGRALILRDRHHGYRLNRWM